MHSRLAFSPALAAAALAMTASSGTRPMLPNHAAPADLIVTAGHIYTADTIHPAAQAFAARGGRIVFVGDRAGALALRGPATRVLDLPGRTILPGLADAHAHLLNLGTFLHNVDLTGTATYDEVIARVAARARATPPGQWIIGRGWDQNRWPDRAFPIHDALSRAVSDHPVMLTRVDGHALLANAKAMALAGVTAATPDPAGGRIERKPGSREPTGVFVDNAKSLIERAVPPLSDAEIDAALLAGQAEAERWGLVSVHDPGEPERVLARLEALAKDRRLTLRVYAMVADDSAALAHAFARGPLSALYGGHLWIRAVKLYADGALGSRGAALLAPYSDDPANVGLLRNPPAHLRDVAVRALRAGFQVATHAIGDRGNRVALDAYASALAEVAVKDHRFRIEHAQVLSPADIPRFAQLGVIPSMQATHATSDMPWAERRLGPERIKGAYAWRSLLATGVIIPNGTDTPVEPVNPLRTFHSAITRQNEANQPPGGWYPAQRMTRDEALASMTRWAAYAAFEEQVMGTLSPGKYADFTVLDRDIMTAAPEEILGTHVLATYVGGAAVYQR
ncbi:MAG TPA: amidohydrolase [Gemmatimonadales bacterium]|nr:amidohydrolase [Gemmatimonadales bacterium]